MAWWLLRQRDDAQPGGEKCTQRVARCFAPFAYNWEDGVENGSLLSLWDQNQMKAVRVCAMYSGGARQKLVSDSAPRCRRRAPPPGWRGQRH